MKKLSSLEFLIILAISVFFIIPSLSTMFDWYTVLILCLGYFLFAFFFLIRSGEGKKKSLMLFGIVVISSVAFSFLAEPITTSGTDAKFKFLVSNFEQLFFSFFPAFLLYRIHTSASKKQIDTLVIVFFIAVVYVMSHTLRELAINPYLTRINDVDSEIAKKNVANYEFVYTITGIIPVLGHYVFRARDRLFRIVMAFALVWTYIFIFKAQYTLSFIISTAALAVVFYSNLPGNVIARVFFLTAAIVAISLSSSLLSWLAGSVESEDMSVRFGELLNWKNTGTAEGDLEHRLFVYTQSIMDFFKSPIWGNYHLTYNPHSTFLTWLAYSGLIGSIPLFYLYYETSRVVRRFFIEPYSLTTYKAVILTLVLNGLTNPIHANNSYSMVVYFFAPLLLIHFSHFTNIRHS